MKYIFAVIAVSISSVAMGQVFSLRGTITDAEGQPIPFATVQLVDTESKTLNSYAIADQKGVYELSVKHPGNFELLVSHLGFLNQKKSVSLNSATYASFVIDFNMEANPVALKEVVITPEVYGRISTDTINYYVSQFTDGSEKALKDVLNKLPGIEVTNDGKVTANGKDVDKLLIDGEDFFFDQQKMATENLSADMVANVQLLNSYFNNPLQKDFGQDGQTALNIGLKEEYRKKPSGDISAGGGIQDKYSIHSNLYRFGKKLKTGFIADVNNTGTDAFTFDNMSGFTGGISRLMQTDGNREGIIRINQGDESIGLQGGKDAKSRRSFLAGFNINYRPDPKLRISSYFILNQGYRDEFEKVNRSYLLPDGEIMTFNQTDREKKQLLGSLFLDAGYRFSDKLSFAYRADLSSTKSRRTDAIDDRTPFDSSFFNQNRNDRRFSFGQFLNVTNKIDDRSLLTINLFHETEKNVSDYRLISDSLFLGLPLTPASGYQIIQESSAGKTTFGMEAIFTRKYGKTRIRSTIGWNNSSQPLSLELDQVFSSEDKEPSLLSQYGGELISRINDFHIGIYWMKNNGLLQFRIGPAVHYYLTGPDEGSPATRLAILPTVQLLLEFREGHTLMAGYYMRNQFPSVSDMSDGKRINDYKSLSRGRASGDDYTLTQTLSIQYVFFDMFSGTVISANARYSKSLWPLTASMTGNADYSLTEVVSGTTDENYQGNLMFNKKLGSVPLGIYVNGSFNQNTGYNYLENMLNKVESVTMSMSSGLSTRFKFPLNAETGLEYRLVAYKTTISSGMGNFDSYKPYVRLNCFLKTGFTSNVVLSRAGYSTNMQKNKSWILDMNFRYKPVKRNTEVFLSFSNLLNLGNYQWIDTQYQQNYFEERLYRTLPGYILAGIKYNI